MIALLSIIINGKLYDLGYNIKETIMVSGMVSKAPFMILEMVAKIQQKSLKTSIN